MGHLAKCCKSFAKSFYAASDEIPGDVTTRPGDVASQHRGAEQYMLPEERVASCDCDQRNTDSFLQ